MAECSRAKLAGIRYTLYFLAQGVYLACDRLPKFFSNALGQALSRRYRGVSGSLFAG